MKKTIRKGTKAASRTRNGVDEERKLTKYLKQKPSANRSGSESTGALPTKTLAVHTAGGEQTAHSDAWRYAAGAVRIIISARHNCLRPLVDTVTSAHLLQKTMQHSLALWPSSGSGGFFVIRVARWPKELA